MSEKVQLDLGEVLACFHSVSTKMSSRLKLCLGGRVESGRGVFEGLDSA